MTIQKTTLSWLGFGLVSLIFIVFIIYPLFSGLRLAAKDLASQQANLVQLEAEKQNMRNFKMFRSVYQENLAKIDNLFINIAEPVNFIEFLEKESAQSHLAVEISPLAPKTVKDDVWSSMEFSLKLFGSFTNFLRFFDKLESGPYLIEALNLDVRRLTESALKIAKFENFSEGDISAVLLIKAYDQ